MREEGKSLMRTEIVLPIEGSTKLKEMIWRGDDPSQGQVGELQVTFPRGGVYVYHDVPFEVVREIAGSVSRGEAFHRLIEQGGFAYQRAS